MWKRLGVLLLLALVGAGAWFGASVYTRHSLNPEMDELRARIDTLERERAQDEADRASHDSQSSQAAAVTTRADILTFSTALAPYYNEALGLLQDSSFCSVLQCLSKMWLENDDVPAAQRRVVSTSLHLGGLREDVSGLLAPAEMRTVASSLLTSIDDHIDFLTVVMTYDSISDFYGDGYSRWGELKTAYEKALAQWETVLQSYGITAAEVGLDAGT